MYCMKCGREVKGSQIFCDQCLSVMKQYPVKQDIRIQLPHRAPSTEKKVPTRRKTLSPEEQISKLRNMVKRLLIAFVCVLLLLVFTVSLLFHDYDSLSPENTIGKNYNTIDIGSDTN